MFHQTQSTSVLAALQDCLEWTIADHADIMPPKQSARDQDPVCLTLASSRCKNPFRGYRCLSGDSTQTGKTVEQLQLVLPRAKVIYSSATGASEPNNLVCCWPPVGFLML